MSFDVGINFRATSGYVTDPAGTTYALGESYPTTRGGLTFGWTTSGSNTRDRSTSIDPRLSGIYFATDTIGTPIKFRVDLPSAGATDIYCGLGDAGSSNNIYLQVLDNTTSLGVLVPDDVSGSGFFDATATAYSAANWPSSNAKATKTFGSTTAIFQLSPGATSGAKNYVIAHLRVAQGASGVTLVVANLSSTPTTSSIALTQTHALSVSNASSNDAVGTVALSQTHQLAASNLSSTPSVPTVNISVSGALIVASLTSSPTVGNVALTQTHSLAVASASSAPAVPIVTLSGILLAVSDCIFACFLDSIDIEQELLFTWSKESARGSSWTKDSAVTNIWS